MVKLCPHGVDTRMAVCCPCADPAFNAASRNNLPISQKFSLSDISGTAETALTKIEQVTAERDALAARCKELEAKLAEAKNKQISGFYMVAARRG